MAKLNNALRSLLADALAPLITVSVYSGSIPATGETAPTGTKLVEWGSTLSWGAAVNGVITLTGVPLTSDAALATGTAGYASITDGTSRMYLTVGTSGAEMNFSTLSIVASGFVDLTSATFTMPAT